MALELKDHNIRQLVNDLRNIAEKFHAHGSLRYRISGAVGQFIDAHFDRRAAPSSSASDALPPEDVAAIRDALECYAESYDTMARMRGGGNKVDCTSVAYDIRRNMVESVCIALNKRRAAIQAAAPADAPMQTFEEWWSTPSKVSGHAPSDVMDGYSARSAWVAARRAPAEDAREQQLAGVKEEGKEG